MTNTKFVLVLEAAGSSLNRSSTLPVASLTRLCWQAKRHNHLNCIHPNRVTTSSYVLGAADGGVPVGLAPSVPFVPFGGAPPPPKPEFSFSTPPDS